MLRGLDVVAVTNGDWTRERVLDCGKMKLVGDVARRSRNPGQVQGVVGPSFVHASNRNCSLGTLLGEVPHLTVPLV